MVPRADPRINRVTIEIVRKPLFLFAVAAASVGAVAACVGDDPVSTTPAPDASTDAASDSSVVEDAADSGPSVDASTQCKIDAPFTTVERVAAFSTDNGDYGLSFTADGLSAYVATGFGAQVIFVHTRARPDVPFGAAIPLSGMPDTSYNYSPTISPDGKELFFGHRVKTSGEVDIYRADIGSGGATNVAPVPGINHPDAGVLDESPFLANERALYFARRLDVTQGYRIFRAERATPTAPFDKVVPVNGLGTSLSEANAVVTSDELHVYFGANEEDAGLDGFARIMLASRAKVEMPFGAAVPVDKLDIPNGRDAPLWLTPDRCTLYFFSDRGKLGTNDPDIWVAKRTP